MLQRGEKWEMIDGAYMGNTEDPWAQETLMDISQLFDGMYFTMWSYTNRPVAHFTIKEKDGMYDATKIKCILRFIQYLRDNELTMSFDNTLAFAIERYVDPGMRSAIDWKATLEKAAIDGVLPKQFTFYVGGKLPDGK